MKMSENGLKLLSLREGERLRAYKDTKGIWTIGVGDTDLNNDGVRDVKEGQTITKEQSVRNLALDVTLVEDVVNKQVKSALTQNQFDALVSFVFNVGITAFGRSTMLKVLNLGNYAEAAKQFDRWTIPVEITSRRMSEKAQFLQQ
jgi:lysozyme